MVAPGPGPCRYVKDGLATLAQAGPRRPGREARLRRPPGPGPCRDLSDGLATLALAGPRRPGREARLRRPPGRGPHRATGRSAAPAEEVGSGSFFARNPNQEGPPADQRGGSMPRGDCSLPLVLLEVAAGTERDRWVPAQLPSRSWKPPAARAGRRSGAPSGRSRSQGPALRGVRSGRHEDQDRINPRSAPRGGG